MKGTERYLVEFMNETNAMFFIPVYQRNYDWRHEQCERLLSDILEVGEKEGTHFFGSIVVSPYRNLEADRKDYTIIDGQQRLTTVSLLFLALYRLLQEGKIRSRDKEGLLKRIESSIFATYSTDPKLNLVQDDAAAYERLFNGVESVYIENSNVTLNFRFFYNAIQRNSPGIDIDKFYRAIKSLLIIEIRLAEEDDAQLIFESLNSTGLALQESDKIRNYLLMGLPPDKQKDFYEKYWYEIERNTETEIKKDDDRGTSRFVRDYLMVKQKQVAFPKEDRIYSFFKAYKERSELNIEALLSDMLAYSKRYRILLKGYTGQDQDRDAWRLINNSIFRFNRLGQRVVRPFFLEVLRLSEEGKLALDDAAAIFNLVESYIFRRAICDIPTNPMNKTFAFLHQEIKRYDGTEENYLEKFKYAFSIKKERGIFPTDREFQHNFSERDIYGWTKKNKEYLFERFENDGKQEAALIYGHMDDKDYSIVPIMPQELTWTWQKDLGENAEEVHAAWCNRLANLTLAGYDKKYSTASFSVKKDVENGFKDSGIHMNQAIAHYEKWTEKELSDRNKDLMQQAIRIWPFPCTTYKPEGKPQHAYSLAAEIDFTDTDVRSFSFKNKNPIRVKNWRDLFEEVLNQLHEGDPFILNNRVCSEDKPAWLANTDEEMRVPIKLHSGVYIEGASSTAQKIRILKILFDWFGEDPEDLVFYLRDSGETEFVGRQG